MAESRRRRTGQRRGGRRDGVDGRDRERGDRTGGGCPAVAQPAGHGVVLGVLLRGQERRGREGHDAVGERGRQGPQLALRRSRCRGPDPPGPVAVGQVLRHRVRARSEEHTSELQSRENLVCRLLLEKKKKKNIQKLNFTKKKTKI